MNCSLQHFGLNGDGGKSVCVNADGSGFWGAEKSSPCLVYSFGINYEWSFDSAMRDRGCEVHSFDPTGGRMLALHGNHTHAGVTFHPWGLSSALPSACPRHRLSNVTWRSNVT